MLGQEFVSANRHTLTRTVKIKEGETYNFEIMN